MISNNTSNDMTIKIERILSNSVMIRENILSLMSKTFNKNEINSELMNISTNLSSIVKNCDNIFNYYLLSPNQTDNDFIPTLLFTKKDEEVENLEKNLSDNPIFSTKNTEKSYYAFDSRETSQNDYHLSEIRDTMNIISDQLTSKIRDSFHKFKHTNLKKEEKKPILKTKNLVLEQARKILNK